MSVRARQVLAVLGGVVVAGVMVVLGLWQMASYQESTRDVSAARAAEDAVPLTDNVSESGEVADIYGRRVTVSGSYGPEEVLVGESWPVRVTTVFQMDDGRNLAVVRGALDDGEAVPPAPAGDQEITGVFLAPDLPAQDSATGADLGSLRVQSLAQTWPSPLVAGYVTLPAEASAEQGLAEAPLQLPTMEGSPTHRGYALQWWVFAAGAVGFGIYVARGFGRQPSPDRVEIPDAEPGPDQAV